METAAWARRQYGARAQGGAGRRRADGRRGVRVHGNRARASPQVLGGDAAQRPPPQ